MRESVELRKVVEVKQSRDETARNWTIGSIKSLGWSCEMWASFAGRFAFELGVC